MTTSTGVCHGCKQLKELVYTDELDREYCKRCNADLPVPSEVLGLEYLMASVPYEEGDRVECRTAGVIFDGIGIVQDISFEIARGGGTPIFPSFLVKIDEPATESSPEQGWYHEICLFPAGKS